jgi:hypothetical protein
LASYLAGGNYVDYDLSSYDPSGWVRWSSAAGEFTYSYPEFDRYRCSWYRVSQLPSSSIGLYTGVFSTLPSLVSGQTDVYQATGGGSGKCYYISNGASPPMYYMALKIWSASTLTIPASGSAITSKENGMAYVSNYTNSGGERGAVVIDSFSNLNSWSMHYTSYCKVNSSKFTVLSSGSVSLPMLTREIGGSYYVPCNSLSSNSLAGVIPPLAYDVTSISGYDSSTWKKWSEVSGQFA